MTAPIIYGHQSAKDMILDSIKSLGIDYSKLHAAMLNSPTRSKAYPCLSPFNKFLIAKEMTLSDVSRLNSAEEYAFFDEYAAWKKNNCPGVEI